MFLQAKRLSKLYDKSVNPTVLVDQVTLSLKYGELVCVMGPSGSGKTSLLHILASLDQADEGSLQYFIEGHKVPATDVNFGVIFSHGNLFNDFTIGSNLKLQSMLKGISKKKFEERFDMIAKRYKIVPLLDLYPYHLSEADRKLVALAKMDLIQPHYCFLDEPTMNMHAAYKADYMNHVARLARHSGALMVTNDTDCAAHADWVIFFENATIKGEMQLDPDQLVIEREAQVYSWLKGKGW